MRQLVCNTPGEFEYKLGIKPVLKSGQAIIKVKRIGVCGTDLHAFDGTQPFFSYPRILGHELAGEIVAIEPNSDFEIGEMVTFIPYFNCGKCIACRNEKPNCCTDIKVFGVHIDGGRVVRIDASGPDIYSVILPSNSSRPASCRTSTYRTTTN